MSNILDEAKTLIPRVVKRAVLEQFPNGLKSWTDTHYEVVSHLTVTRDKKGTQAYKHHQDGGTLYLYDLAWELTDEWENNHVGVDWEERDYWIEIEEWLDEKDKQN